MAKLTKKQKRAKDKKERNRQQAKSRKRCSKDHHAAAYQMATAFAPLIALNLLKETLHDTGTGN